jgi:hypothetical protein
MNPSDCGGHPLEHPFLSEYLNVLWWTNGHPITKADLLIAIWGRDA